MPNKPIVFLYSELAGYFISCVKELRNQFDGEIHVIHWPVNPEAPFNFNFPEGVSFKDKNEVDDLHSYVRNLDPGLIISAGWMDKDYVAICKNHKGKIPTVVSMDNQWTGNSKQLVASKLSRFILRNKFSHIWVPGQRQKTFAEKLGFKNILMNYYCADEEKFSQFYNSQKGKRENFPKRFLYVGRYLEHKGIYEMWDAFLAANKNYSKEWELWCLGTGDEFEQRKEAAGIVHHGFVQPDDLEDFLNKTSVFVLPSRIEPWGVVVHEYALSGFPLICSNAVGAADRFLKPRENGFTYNSGNVQELQGCFEKFMGMDQIKLEDMSKKSRELGLSLTPRDWAAELLNIDRACAE